MRAILVAAEDGEAAKAVKASFRGQYRVETAWSRETCEQLFAKAKYDFLFIDLDFLAPSADSSEGIGDYAQALQKYRQAVPHAEIVVMGPPDRIRDAVMAVKAGASNYITYPVNAEELRYMTESIRRAALMQSELNYLRDRFWRRDSLEVVKTRSPVMMKVFQKVRSVAPTKTSVLLTGETGTGKGLLAKLLHSHSNRADSQFITVHCGAIPDSLLESELFGHEKGAFTGADRRKLGKFEIANRGTIFLDEIGTITPSAQIKLLQVLQDRTFQRLGGESTIEADVRVIVATNSDLKTMSDEGLFRKDLYYRLCVFPIEVPPLRERKEDIPHLVECFIRDINGKYSKGIFKIDPEVLEAFDQYDWPGNIRELENLVERAYILEESSVLTSASFPAEIFGEQGKGILPEIDISLPISAVRKKAVEAVESSYLKAMLARKEGRLNRSAEAAGITTRQLHKLLAKYGIRKEDFKWANERDHHEQGIHS
ncbi:MAG: Fis family transcriptional regulator [Deltaproteobacteria bacterium CG_4_8_14_3_um_filter_51_11]|nr:sigma-54-dependent Fis family transcriptional regulator [bacterium]OIP43282.1 MAG: Fis family transcriptional regulator [Desulfobacteraceae bacterium CG2_30_51_40]PIP48188.1 MAG: Fis family transcriptional regulator [Deltaproteobacteria bacterium CG23_combo_of_CG06-09_8_20_14_all_51_20]PIX19591.1 MAG: Fis family transcriptional regulator [Deltaproteobacteria bacterium CG_4_8_14_3_um_filter_51_11]PIY21507.1 MAG: Fis family transcriptional regulator [Deltaproteobacteria bacterium CG_4_10_14_3_